LSNPTSCNPGDSTIGILGNGQLGRMLAFVAKRCGYKVVVFAPDTGGPAGQIADIEIKGEYTDIAKLNQFAEKVDVITYEFENIPLLAVEHLSAKKPVRPGIQPLKVAQNRLNERQIFTNINVPCANFLSISSEKDLAKLPENFTFPAILKTAELGYDGKGQAKIDSAVDLKSSWEKLHTVPCLLEEKIDFTLEFSMIIARGLSGKYEIFGPIENKHENHILAVSSYPGGIPEVSAAKAAQYLTLIAEKLELVGLLTAEFFLLKNGDVLVNELAPRPHNSGHLTIEGCLTSQFEQQLRTTCGYDPLPFAPRGPAAMINLLGDLWFKSGDSPVSPDFSKISNQAGIYLHLYGKDKPKQGRKMGHITIVAENPTQLAETTSKIQGKLGHLV
jgi:5-(carboxyamino)imidazole ribonucleotide synthase